MTQRKDNGHGEEILVLMRSHELFAVDTLFKPVRKAWGKKGRLRYCNATYMAKDESKRPRKLDYIIVSNRWKGMVKITYMYIQYMFRIIKPTGDPEGVN